MGIRSSISQCGYLQGLRTVGSVSDELDKENQANLVFFRVVEYFADIVASHDASLEETLSSRVPLVFANVRERYRGYPLVGCSSKELGKEQGKDRVSRSI